MARPNSVAKGENFAKRFGIKKVYTDYGELLKDNEIDAVYVGLINSVHYAYAKEALLAGKRMRLSHLTIALEVNRDILMHHLGRIEWCRNFRILLAWQRSMTVIEWNMSFRNACCPKNYGEGKEELRDYLWRVIKLQSDRDGPFVSVPLFFLHMILIML